MTNRRLTSRSVLATDPVWRHLKQVRDTLLRIHKLMLDAERQTYEQLHGPIQTNNQLLTLLMEDSWFAWLREISKFVVEMDEVIMGRELLTPTIANQFLDRTQALMVPKSDGSHFEQQYYRAVQDYAEVTMAHAELSQHLEMRHPEPPED